MNKEIILSWFCIVLLASCISVGEVGAIQVLPDTDLVNPDPVLDPKEEYTIFLPRVGSWTCYDYSVEFSKQHPEYGIVIISDHPQFLGNGNSHFVNYIINSDKHLIIHDELNQKEFLNGGLWYADPNIYFHFYLDDEIPTRHFYRLKQNAEVFYGTL